jgi:hypothetical protein
VFVFVILISKHMGVWYSERLAGPYGSRHECEQVLKREGFEYQRAVGCWWGKGLSAKIFETLLPACTIPEFMGSRC